MHDLSLHQHDCEAATRSRRPSPVGSTDSTCFTASGSRRDRGRPDPLQQLLDHALIEHPAGSVVDVGPAPLLDRAGSVTTFGSRLFEDAEPDDVVVARLPAARAIVIGRTSTTAFGHTAVTTNLLFGTTRNPWNIECSPGGSSGGSAAVLAAGSVPIAITFDGGGIVLQAEVIAGTAPDDWLSSPPAIRQLTPT